MGKRDPIRVQQRHGEGLTRLDEAMAAMHYTQALEIMKRILGDPTRPPAARAQVTIKQGQALLGLGHLIEAGAIVIQLGAYIQKHRLND